VPPGVEALLRRDMITPLAEPVVVTGGWEPVKSSCPLISELSPALNPVLLWFGWGWFMSALAMCLQGAGMQGVECEPGERQVPAHVHWGGKRPSSPGR
jgi:hypothetical protein